jgi:hypothetical protein
VDVILEVIPTEEQRAERVGEQKRAKGQVRHGERDRARNKEKI